MKPAQANNRGRSLAIVGLVIVLTMLTLVRCRSLSTVPGATPTSSPAASQATPGAPMTVSVTTAPTLGTASAPATAVVPTAMPPTALVAPTAPASSPAHPTYTPPTPVVDARLQQAAEQLGQQLKQEQGMVATGQECEQVWQQQQDCLVYLATTPLIRPEWQQLFPHTDFFFAKNATLINNIDQYAPLRGSQVIALQDGQRYTAATFPRLLDANGIVITDQNRELVAKAFVLMTLAYYLEGDVTFSDAGEIDVQGGFSFERFNYGITTWTRLQGLQITYGFIFEQGHLLQVAGSVITGHTGDYTEVPSDLFPYPVPLPLNYNFRGR